MFIRAYLRASTDEQNAARARAELEAFANEHRRPIASWYQENASGATADRAELLRLLEDAHPGDVLLVESVDRLSRLTLDDWQRLRGRIDAQGLRVVTLDLPTSHAAMTADQGDDITARILDAVNRMMLDVLAAVARKDYEDRRKRQRQGIEAAQQAGRYRGRPKDEEKRAKILQLIEARDGEGRKFGNSRIAKMAGCSETTVKRVKRELRAEAETGNG